MNTLHDRSRKFTRLTTKDKQEILAALRSKVSAIELSKRFGVSRQSIHALSKKSGQTISSSAAPTVLTVRLDASDIRAIDALSSELGLTRAETCRRVLRRSSGFLDMDIEDRSAILAAARQLKAIGVNLNQLVAHANRKALVTGQGEISEDDLRQICEMRDDVAHFLDNIVGSIRNIVRFRKLRVDDLLAEIGS